MSKCHLVAAHLPVCVDLLQVRNNLGKSKLHSPHNRQHPRLTWPSSRELWTREWWNVLKLRNKCLKVSFCCLQSDAANAHTHICTQCFARFEQTPIDKPHCDRVVHEPPLQVKHYKCCRFGNRTAREAHWLIRSDQTKSIGMRQLYESRMSLRRPRA